MKVKVALVQMKVIFDQPEVNLRHAKELIAKAALGGAQIAVLPECSDLGWGTVNAKNLAETIPGATSDYYCEVAKEYKIFLVVGITEREQERIYNTALLISDQGEILLKHRKINVLTGVEDMYAIGDRLGVAKTKFGTIGIDICADNSYHSIVIGHTLARMGAGMVLSPCAWAVKPDRNVEVEPYGEEWIKPYGELANLYHIPIIGVSNVGQVESGTWKGWKAIGNSIAMGRDGQILAILPYGEEVEATQILEVETGVVEKLGTELAASVSID